MIPAIMIMVLAFGWLLWETRWLRVRLPYGEGLILGLVSTVVGLVIARIAEEVVEEV